MPKPRIKLVPQFLFVYCSQNKTQVVAVEARSQRHARRKLERYFMDNGVAQESIREKLDTYELVTCADPRQVIWLNSGSAIAVTVKNNVRHRRRLRPV